MRVIAISLILLFSISLEASDLFELSGRFMERLREYGFEGTGSLFLYADLQEPCTLCIYPPIGARSGYLGAMGGSYILNLQMNLSGSNWIKRDTFPDDFPIFKLDSMEICELEFIEITILDMTHNARSDTLVFLFAFDNPPSPAGDTFSANLLNNLDI